MDVVSVCPLRTASLVWQPRPGSWCITVVCKATFELVPGEARLADEQEYPNEDDNHWNDDPQRSLYSPSDLAPFKQRGEVTLVGHAFAPRGEPVRSLVARMIVGEIDKSIEVHGERSWSQDGLLREGPRFAKMPLRYERAAGGPETRNPVGVRVDGRPDAYGNVAIANLQQTGLLVTDRSDRIEPIGFGPIAPAWSSRLDRLGRHASAWSHGRWHDQPLPEDVDAGYWNAAPPDQQITAIRDNERLVLENLHPEHARLVTMLPGIRPRGFVERGGAVQEVSLACDTLWIDTDRSICTLTWRGQIGVDGPEQAGRVVIGMESGTARLTWADLQRGEGRETIGRDATADDSSGRGALAELSAPRPMVAPAQVRPPPPSAPRNPTDASDMAALRRQHPTLNAVPLPSAEFTNALPFVASFDGARPSSPGAAAPPPPLPDGMPAWMQRPRGPGGPPSVGASGPPSRTPQPPAPPPPLAVAAPPPPPPMASPPMAAPAPPSMSSMAVDSPWAGGSRPVGPAAPSFASPSSFQAGSQASPGPFAPPIAAPSAPAAWPAAAAGAPPPIAAALAGLVAASDAAADKRPGLATQGSSYATPGEALELLWFDKEAAPRLRRRSDWKKILDKLEEAPRDPEVDQASLSEDPAEIEDRREIFEITAHGAPCAENGVDQAVTSAVRADGRFTPQLVLLSGEVRFDFDELETLKATVSAAKPFAGADADLKAAIETASAFLATPDVIASPEVTAAMTTLIREAFSKNPRPVPATYLEDQTERALLDRRAYQKRGVFGAPHVRSVFLFPGSTTGVPTYFPEAVAKKLPLFRRLRVRMLAEAQFQADQYETHPTALRCAALVRVVSTRYRDEPRA